MQECNEHAALVGRNFADYSAGHRRMYEAGLVLLGESEASVLDVGAGIGWGYHRARELGFSGSWVGVEPCRDSFDYLVTSRIGATWHHAGLMEAVVDPADFVFCIEVIEHIDKSDAPAFIDRLRNLTRKTLYLSTPESDRDSHGTFTRAELVAALKAGGFAEVVVVDEQWTTLYICQ
jgi:2-polyprenyl-3-methyl-5-hydroxy-6-metoxy-1,4-benzoquinol methylase